MFVRPIEQYQQANAAYNAFTKDVGQRTQHLWDEVGQHQFEFLRLCQECGEYQLRILGNGFIWKELAIEQANIAHGFWRQSLSHWRKLFDSFTETSAQVRACGSRIGPVWTLTAWEEARGKVAQAVDAARDEALKQINRTRPATPTPQPPERSRRAAEGKKEAA